MSVRCAVFGRLVGEDELDATVCSNVSKLLTFMWMG
jgi:hypothetical protein